MNGEILSQFNKREKEIWNEAIRKATNELRLWDGIIPDKSDREFIVCSIREKLMYKIKHRENF